MSSAYFFGHTEPFKNYAIVAISRFGVSPALCLWLLWMTKNLWMGLSGGSIAAFVIFLQSASPLATNLAVMSRRAAARAEGESIPTAEAIPRILLVSYTLATVFVPLWLVIFLRLLHTPK